MKVHFSHLLPGQRWDLGRAASSEVQETTATTKAAPHNPSLPAGLGMSSFAGVTTPGHGLLGENPPHAFKGGKKLTSRRAGGAAFLRLQEWTVIPVQIHNDN